MSWFEDKIKRWEASDDVDWLKAQLAELGDHISEYEKTAGETESALRAELDGWKAMAETNRDANAEACNMLYACRAELADALARVGELEVLARECANNWVCDLPGEIVSEELCGRDKLCRRCMAIKALALPTLGAASRLRDEVLEECAGICDDEAKSWEDEDTDPEEHTEAFALYYCAESIRARKSKEAE